MSKIDDLLSATTAGFVAVASQRNTDFSALQGGIANVDIKAEKALADLEKLAVEVTPEKYRLPGYNDAQAIQAAIDAVTALVGGGSVRLDGQYTCNAPVVLKSNVRLHGGTLKASNTLTAGYLIALQAGAVNPKVCDVNIDCVDMQPETTKYGATAIQDFGGCRGVVISGNVFTLADTDETSSFVPWHACVMANSQGVVANNYSGVCGGDTFNFNGGRWVITGNYVQDSADGGIALNNDIHAVVTGNYLYKCNLGVGAGPHGTPASPFRVLHVTGNVVESCAVGVNAGWYGYAGRVPAQYMNISGNTILRCRDAGIYYISSDGADKLAPHIHDNIIAETGSTSYNGRAGPGEGIAVVGCTYADVQGNKVVKSAGFAYVLSGVKKTVFANNASFENNVDIKYEECSLYHGQLFCDRANPNNIEVGTITLLTDYRKFKEASVEFLKIGVSGQMYFTEEGNFPRLVWDGSRGTEIAYNRTNDEFELRTRGTTLLKLGEGGMSLLGSPMSFEKDYVGTTNGSGSFSIAHNIPSATSRVRGIRAMIQEGGGNWVNLPNVGLDVSVVGVSGVASNRPVRIIVTWSKNSL